MRSRSLLLVGFLVLLLPNLLFAQTNAGSLSGHVTDASGGGAPRRYRYGDEQRHRIQSQRGHGSGRQLSLSVAAGRHVRGHGRSGRLRLGDDAQCRGQRLDRPRAQRHAEASDA